MTRVGDQWPAGRVGGPAVVRPAETATAVRPTSQLDRALASRVVIEQAKGFVAALDGTTPRAAFDRLRRYARAHDLRTHDVAFRIVTRQLVLPPEVARA